MGPLLYRAVYNEGVSFLSGMEDAALDARLLLEEACGTRINDLLSDPDRPVSAEEYAAYREYLELRKSRIPTAYIIGCWDFMSLKFKVNDDVLIPEQDTEILAEEAMKVISGGMRILDLCTGSGCILLSLLNYSYDTYGTGTDISEKALKVAEENADRLGLSKRCRFLQGDLFDALKDIPEDKDKLFDIIVSNPPYIPSSVIDTLEPEVRACEPYISLDGGEDGLDFYRKMAGELPAYLKPGGMVFLETGYDQTGDVCKMLLDAGLESVSVFNDYGGNPRVVLGRKGVLKHV